MNEGVWVALRFDFFSLAIFSTDEELEARRYADEHNMSVHFVEFGTDIRQQILGNRRLPTTR